MLIEACEPMLREGTILLDVIGEGPQRPVLESLVASRSIPNVKLLGNIPHARLAATLAGYDVLGFPSIREFGGAVAAEAMALGVVPIVPNYGGLGELVSPAAGFLIAMGTRRQLIDGFRSTISSILANPQVLRSKAQAGIARVRRHFTWDAKARMDLCACTIGS